VWRENLNKIRIWAGLVNEGWLVDNINREVRNEMSTLFLRDTGFCKKLVFEDFFSWWRIN